MAAQGTTQADPGPGPRKRHWPDLEDPKDRLAMRKAFARVGLWLVVAAAVGYPFAAAAKLWSIPSADFWSTWTWLLVVLPCLALIGAARRIGWLQERVLDREATIRQVTLEADREKARLRRDLEKEERKYLLDTACRWLLVAVSQQTTLPLDSFGASVWLVPTDSERPRLRRILHCPIEPRQKTRIVWTRGKGVIGQAWERDEEFIVDLAPLHGLSQQAFDSLEQDARLNMSWIEADRSKAYAAVWAIPLRIEDPDGEERLVGIMSVDCKATGCVAAIVNAVPHVGGQIYLVREHFAQWREKDGIVL